MLVLATSLELLKREESRLNGAINSASHLKKGYNMTRKLALEHLRVAIIKGDKATATRLFVENRISRATYNKMWREYGKKVTMGYSK